MNLFFSFPHKTMGINRSRRQALSVFDVNKSNVSSSTESICRIPYICGSQQSSTGSPPKDLHIMQALFRLLFEAFNPLFFKSFVQHREFLALKAQKREKLNAIPFQTLTGKEKMKSNPSQRDKLRSTLSRTIFMYLEVKLRW